MVVLYAILLLRVDCLVVLLFVYALRPVVEKHLRIVLLGRRDRLRPHKEVRPIPLQIFACKLQVAVAIC